MPFCRNCGNEVSLEAFVCISCGSLIDERKKPEIDSEKHLYQHASFWLLFAGVICFFVSLFWFVLAIIEAGLNIYSNYGYIYLDYDNLIFTFAFSIFAFITILSSFITSYHALKHNLCTKTYTYITLLLMICSVIYFFATVLAIN